MTNGQILRRINRGILIAFLLGCALHSLAQSSTFLIKEGKDDPRLKITEQALHHDLLGTGFVAEIDLAKLPEWKGELTIIPVEDPDPGYQSTSRPNNTRYDMHGNPINATVSGIAQLFSLFAIKREKRPLVIQTVFPLDSGLAHNPDGTITVRQVPPDKKIHIHIPHALVRDSGRVYFVLPDSIFKYPQQYLFTPPLLPDTLMPDLRVKVLRTVDTRYAGASGQMVTVGYQFPKYYHSLRSRCAFMWPRLTLNGKYTIYKPKSYLYPAEWDLLDSTAWDLTFFIPDAFFDDNGRANVEMSCKCTRGRMRIGYAQLEFEQTERKEKVKVEIEVEKMVRKERYKKTFVEVPNRLQYLIGGIHFTEGEYSDDPPGNTPKWNWIGQKPVLIIATVGDSVNIRTTENLAPWSGVGYSHTTFFMDLNQSNRGLKEDFQLKYICLFGEGKKKLRETFTLFTKVFIK